MYQNIQKNLIDVENLFSTCSDPGTLLGLGIVTHISFKGVDSVVEVYVYIM